MFGVGRMLRSFLDPSRGYRKAQEQMDKYYNQAQSAYHPYIQHGEDAYGNLSGAMQNLLNPAELYDQFSGSYEPSEAARLTSEAARNSGMTAMSSLGLLGSTPALRAIQAGEHDIMAHDKQNYINNLMNQYFKGAEIAQGIYGTGANAGQNMGQNAMQMGQNSAQLAYGKENAPGQMLNDLLKTAAYAFSGGYGGGAPTSTGNNWSIFGGRR